MYNSQVKLIEHLTREIVKKSKQFAADNEANQNFTDLSYVISELKKIDEFLPNTVIIKIEDESCIPAMIDPKNKEILRNTLKGDK